MVVEVVVENGLLRLSLFVVFVLEHPLHHPLAVVFERHNQEARQKDQRDKYKNGCADLADFEIAK